MKPIKSPFEIPRPLLAIADHVPTWGAILAAAVREDSPHERLVDVRHVMDLDALDSGLTGSQTPVGILLAHDFADLPHVVDFLRRHADRPCVRVLAACRGKSQALDELEWLLREAGAMLVLRNAMEVVKSTHLLVQFFRDRYVHGFEVPDAG